MIPTSFIAPHFHRSDATRERSVALVLAVCATLAILVG